jgi:uncharacterized paraquat-inducible protein A
MPTLTARVKDALSTADEIGVDPVRFFLELLAHRALFDCDVRWIAAVFVGADRTEKRCSAISSCRSAARTSRIRQLRRCRSCNRPLINWP